MYIGTVKGEIMRNYIKLVSLLFTTAFIMMSANVNGQAEYLNQKESCTSIMVGKKATTDGSVITSHSCDGRYRTWLEIVPAKDHADTVKYPVYWGTMFTTNAKDKTGMELKGEIDQVAHTYAYLNTAYPCLNEKQLAIGETTTVGKEELVNTKGLFLIEELQRIALQRCTNAREAIKLMGMLVTKHGYGDYAECLTVADKNEVWQFEVMGEGKDKVGGVWVAQRVPDKHVAVSANVIRVGELDLEDEDYFMASDNVYDVAKKMGYWDGKEPFIFWKAYSNWDKNFLIREYFILNALAPSKKFSYDAESLPFSVEPDRKVDVREVMKLYRSTFEGTEYDMTRNLMVAKKKKDKEGNVVKVDTVLSPVANPWMSRDTRNLLNTLEANTTDYQRTVAVSWCSYSEVIQLRDWLPDEVGGVAWFSFDNPAQSPRFPIFSGSLKLPESFNYSGQNGYDKRSAHWFFRRANRLATVKWQNTREEMLNNILDLEDKAMMEMPMIEAHVKKLIKKGKVEEAKEFVTRYSNDFSRTAMMRWWELGEKYWKKFDMGF
jgi:dipeptidase